MRFTVAKTILLKPIYWNSGLIQNNLGLYIFILFLVLSLFHYNMPKKTLIFLWPIYIRLCLCHVHNRKNNAICGHKKKYIPAMFVFLKAYTMRTLFKVSFFGFYSLILSRTPSTFSFKEWKYYHNLTIFHLIKSIIRGLWRNIE